MARHNLLITQGRIELRQTCPTWNEQKCCQLQLLVLLLALGEAAVGGEKDGKCMWRCESIKVVTGRGMRKEGGEA